MMAVTHSTLSAISHRSSGSTLMFSTAAPTSTSAVTGTARKSAGGASVGHFLSGAAGALVSASLLQPFDVVKTQLIMAPSTQSAMLSGGSAAVMSGAPVSRTFPSLMVSIARSEGIRGLWAGLGPTALRIVPGAGTYFFLLDALKTNVPVGANGKHSDTQNFALGCAARTVAGALTNPFFVVKTRMEYYRSQQISLYRNTFHALATVAKQERLLGLFRGTLACVLRDAPYSGLFLVFYRRMQDALPHYMGDTHSLVQNATASFLAGSFATCLTHPADVVRTHLQVHLAQGSARSSAALANGALPSSREPRVTSIIRDIYAREGAKGFLRGVDARIVKRSLAGMLSWVIYEELTKK